MPDLESYARTLWSYWEENLDESTGRDPKIREALKGKYVVITGASSGIGQVTALKVAQAGGIPVLVARGKDKLEETRAAIERRGGTAHVYPCDLSDLEAIDALCEQLTTELPSVDFVVNNAGRSIRRSLKLSHDRFHDFERTMQLNYFGAIRLVMGLLPAMRKQKRGHIVNISSIGVQTNPPRFSAYVASKAALDSWSNVVASELVGDGITLHRHPHAAGADADDRADQDLRQVPHDLTGAGGRPGDQGDGRAAARDQHRCSATPARSRTRSPRSWRSGCSTWPTTCSPTRPPPRARLRRAAAPASPSRSCSPASSRASTGSGLGAQRLAYGLTGPGPGR